MRPIPLSILDRRRLERVVDRLVVAARDHASLLGDPSRSQRQAEYPDILRELRLAQAAFQSLIKDPSK